MNLVRLLPLLFIAAMACKRPEQTSQSFTAYTGATIIDGSGSTPIQDGVLLISNGRVVAVGTKENVKIPEHATVHDVMGKTIIPGLINAHGHVGDVKGIEGGHYSKENIIDNLSIYARYGITTVVSLGGDKPEAEMLRAVNDTTNTAHARLFIAGEIINGKTPEEAMAVADSNHHMGVDIMKIRVDDNLGTSPKMPEEIYRAAIKRAHELGYKMATHMYYLDDARKLLDAGSDMMAHSVRDLPVDDAFIQLIKQKKACYCPTLTRELSTFVYEDTAEFFSDPFFLREYDTTTIKPLLDPARQKKMRDSKSAQTYKKQLPVAKANLKILCNQDVPIVFGTDSGVPTRFIGYFEHIEMSMMADAGLTPQQILLSATKNPAEYLGLKDVGTLVPGHWADFLVLDADPLSDIKNLREINAVFIAGHEVSR
ncbi:Imidazolonepropionase [Chryseolinea serpens]|uniref:Imidazolonepropionase n=1 Tax=Chryseolinea serpens TaxID=947013 RepID=A0A1M5TN72_9BACT|nr:amidohydrolase family protein [Chryseolinea serpens]SHH52232.1 Imidazolonepropionase [Chryseolinea serpens]